ncbi:hypothetical protein IV500_19505 [Paeniglutamicibacter antarcticus]|uniref:Uncharacterized protein n=1 Tax=Arthrobacter terrae TaxID=2935737 RepID=A0A931G645_9MICC|nr:hypothetical protein [Arthrobacter terrae]MBG0741551.1 hypothetical protein [Arthrobacter terrae]
MSASLKTTRTVGLMADPGLPSALAYRVQGTLPGLLASALDSGVEWTVEVDDQSLPLDANGEVELNMHAGSVRDRTGWDYLVYLTDLPKYSNGRPMLSSTNVGYRSAMIALPALGVLRLSRARRTLLQTIGVLHEADDARSLGQGRISQATASISAEQTLISDHVDENSYETLKGIRGRLQLLAGMVRGNRPWRIVPGLSGAMAAAIATGAFGIFYTSIWSMADYLSPARLALISLLSVTIMTVWLITHNSLWERPVGNKKIERGLSYNLATSLTISIAVTFMYLGLFVVIFLGGLIVIDDQFLSLQLKHPAGIRDYLNLAWLSASLGTIAGALGSSLDDEDSVRKATFSSREYARRQLSKAESASRDEG